MSKTKLSLIRKRAEELMKSRAPGEPSKSSEADVQKLIHELEVYQIELELQNEELIKAYESKKLIADKYYNLYDFAPLGYFTLSREGIIEEVNLAGAALLGKERSYLKNKRFELFLSKNDSKISFRQSFKKMVENNSPQNFQIELPGEDRLPIFLQATIIPFNDENQCLLTAVDITYQIEAGISARTAKEKADNITEYYHQILNTIGEPLFVKDEDSKLVLVNEAFCKLFDLSRDDILGKTLAEDVAPEEMDSFLKIDKQVLADGIESIRDESLTVRGGEKRIISTVKTRLVDASGIRFLVGIIRDLTERKQAELELFNAKERAEESDRLKSAFLANMSHEIRTPMNGILGFADLLKEPGLKGEEQQKYIEIIQKSGMRMLNIINDIISISKIESGQMELDIQESNINDQLDYVYTFFKPEIEQKNMQVTIHKALPTNDAILYTDREKLYAILTNLVKNAIKFSNKGSILFGYTPIINEGITDIEFYVKDTGIGIPKDQLGSVFERFIQVDTFNKNAYQGAGLGLAISQAYVEMLGGEIRVESELGIGSTFYFTIPYHHSVNYGNNADHKISTHSEQIAVNDLIILIAEDDKPSEILLTVSIHKFIKEIINVKTGIEAVESCRNNPDINLILMDIHMPEMDGYEATRQIRKFNKKVIIIAQTASALIGDKVKAMAAGCNDYIAKPVTPDKLIHKINKHIKKAG